MNFGPGSGQRSLEQVVRVSAKLVADARRRNRRFQQATAPGGGDDLLPAEPPGEVGVFVSERQQIVATAGR